MLYQSILYFFVLFLLLLKVAIADTKNDCPPIAVTTDNENIVLTQHPHVKNPTQIYFIQNTSKNSIFIDRVADNPGASAGWSTYLRSGNWAVLALNKKTFAVHCAMIQPGKVVALKCQDTITICTPPHLAMYKKIKGNFWLAEDKSWDAVIKILEKKGIVITPRPPL